ncbi:MAG: hypothetical protein HY459_02225 [Parcubacteria group bacterium]|nr:hypothetical protein [Parcubacteria group bacterium]
MSSKAIIWIGVIVGSYLGGFLPTLWGTTAFSFATLIGNAIGGLLGLWVAYKVVNY